MLRHLGWFEAADLIIDGMEGAIGSKKVTYDFERLMDDATPVSCSEFGQEMINHTCSGCSRGNPGSAPGVFLSLKFGRSA